jgi:hypothetical protein
MAVLLVHWYFDSTELSTNTAAANTPSVLAARQVQNCRFGTS